MDECIDLSSSEEWPRYRACNAVHRFKTEYNNEGLDITLKYSIINVLTARERSYLGARERYNIELGGSQGSLVTTVPFDSQLVIGLPGYQ